MKITGWLVPGIGFLQCDQFNHIKSVRDNPVFVQKVPKIGKLIEELDNLYEVHEQTSQQDGSYNAEWHIYEVSYDETRHEIWRLLLNNGFIRVGEVDGDVHFEGRPNVLKSRYQECKDFADSYGAGAVFEPQR